MTSPPFVLFRDNPAGRELLFEEPSEVIVCDRPENFTAALDRAEALRREGKWLAGYFSYEAGYLLEPKLRPLLPDGRRVPFVCLGVFDRPSDRIVHRRPAPTNGPIFDARAAWTFADYERRFVTLHGHLRQGDCYQANLTFPVDAGWSGDPLDAFDALTARQPVKYGALVSLGGPAILSRSPELFFSVDAQGFIETHPMKGTAPRGATPAKDRRLKEFLRNDDKNLAENRMIVDLLRNDVSLISEVGTLEVPELFRVETYPTLHTMVSRVRARLLPDLTIARLFAALFPCGSVTGAPKIRAMEILRGLEERPRDAYCGAIGWIAPGGTMRFSVAIRTITLFPGDEAVYNVGGGVVFDSTAESEYQECLLKARFATGMVPASGLIETLRWEPRGGLLRGARHLARLAASAAALGFRLDPAAVDKALSDACIGDDVLRIRLALGPGGEVEIETQPFAPLAPETVWRLRIATTRLCSADPLLAHKTTRRDLYDTARAEFPRETADEVLLLNERGEACEGTITSLFVDSGDGLLLTPALGCGLLRGVLRGELLETGRAVEAVLHPHDLARAPALFVGNSLRGLIRARLGTGRD